MDAFVSRTAAFENHKNYADHELGKTRETSNVLSAPSRYPKIKDHYSNREDREIKGIRLRTPDDKTQEKDKTKAGNFCCQKNLSSASENICDDKKPALPALVALTDKNSKDTTAGGRSSKAYDWLIQEIGEPGGVKFVITIPMQ